MTQFIILVPAFFYRKYTGLFSIFHIPVFFHFAWHGENSCQKYNIHKFGKTLAYKQNIFPFFRCNFMAFLVDLRLQSPIIIIFRICSCEQTTEQSQNCMHVCNMYVTYMKKNPVKMERNPVYVEKNQMKMKNCFAWIHITTI
jgi:hypothetical protein